MLFISSSQVMLATLQGEIMSFKGGEWFGRQGKVKCLLYFRKLRAVCFLTTFYTVDHELSVQPGAACCVLPAPEVCISVLPQDTDSTSWSLCSLSELSVPHSSFFAPSLFIDSLVEQDLCWNGGMGRVYTESKTLCWCQGHIGRTQGMCVLSVIWKPYLWKESNSEVV